MAHVVTGPTDCGSYVLGNIQVNANEVRPILTTSHTQECRQGISQLSLYFELLAGFPDQYMKLSLSINISEAK